MNDEMTPREHDDMRDLLIAGTQRIRTSPSRRAQLSAAFAVVVVAGVIGAVATVAVNMGSEGTPADDRPAPTATSTQVPTPVPTPMPTLPPVAEGCEPRDFPGPSLPAATVPEAGEHLVLPTDPCLTAHSLLGSAQWLEDQGIDTFTIQGFQSVAGVEPWTADLKDGSGSCILVRAANGNGWGEIDCDAADAAAIERDVDDVALRFVIQDDAIVVFAASR